MNFPAIRLACIPVAVCLAAMPALEAAEPEDAVRVTGRYDNSVGLWDAASEGGVTPEGIARRPLLRTGELLEAVPGMAVTQHSGDGKANQYFLRGYNLDHGTDFAVWVAGMPVNQGTSAHGHGYLDLNFLIPELVSRMVYRKGPYAAEDGDFSSAGSVRINYADRLPASLAGFTAGSFDYRRALLAGSPQLGAGRLLYGIEYQQNDGGWQSPNKYAKWNGVLRWSQGTPANGFNLSAMAYRASWNATDQIPQRAVEAGQVDRYGALDATDGGGSSRYSLSGEWRQSEGPVSRMASLYAIRSRLDLYSNFTFFLNDAVNGDQFHQAERRLATGGQFTQTWRARLAGADSATTFGVQFRRDRLAPVGLYLTAARTRLGVTREDRVTVESVAPYVSNITQWTSWLRSVAGLRADHHRFAVDSDNAANSGRARDALVSPRLTLAFGPWRNTEFFANWGRGFHSNDARGTTITVNPADGTAADRVPPLVRTRGSELGVRSQPLAGLTASLALWRLDQDSELLFVGDAGNTEASRPSRRRGAELLLQYAPGARLSLDASLAVTRARFANFDPAGGHIPGAPRRVASAGVHYEHASGWFGSLRWRYFGPRPLLEDDSVRSQSTALVNGRLGYAFDRRTRLALDVHNLLDRRQNDIDYWYESQLRGEAAPVFDRHFHPVERRALRLTLTAQF